MSTLANNEKGRGYHHGDLRATLIRIGSEMLAESGEAALSLRQLAQRAGVSHNAPYQHFADKGALIAAIAEEGFRLLSEAIDAAAARSRGGSPIDRLAAVGRAYVEFALAHRAHLQVMFGPYPSTAYPTLAAQAGQTLDRLIAVVADVEAEGHLRTAGGADAAAVVWMTVHGLSAILIADKLPDRLSQGRDPAALTERFIHLIGAGLIG